MPKEIPPGRLLNLSEIPKGKILTNKVCRHCLGYDVYLMGSQIKEFHEELESWEGMGVDLLECCERCDIYDQEIGTLIIDLKFCVNQVTRLCVYCDSNDCPDCYPDLSSEFPCDCEELTAMARSEGFFCSSHVHEDAKR